MKIKFDTILSMLIVVLGILQLIFKSPVLVGSIVVLFALLIGRSLYQAMKEKERIRIVFLIGLGIVYGVIIFNYFQDNRSF